MHPAESLSSANTWQTVSPRHHVSHHIGVTPGRACEEQHLCLDFLGLGSPKSSVQCAVCVWRGLRLLLESGW